MAVVDAQKKADDKRKDKKLSGNRAQSAQVRLNEQCLLMDYWRDLVPFNDRTEYKTFTSVDGDPYTVTHNLVGVGDIRPFLNLTPEQLAVLHPRLKIIKKYYPKGYESEPEFAELPFKDHISQKTLEAMTTDRKTRGDTVGIKSFSYKQIGSTHGDVENNIECSLSLWFSNMNDLFFDHPNGSRFVDLIYYPGATLKHSSRKNKKLKYKRKKSPDETETYDSRDYEVLIEVGWSDPGEIPGLIDGDLRQVVANSQITLGLSLLQHEFSFNQDGSMELKIDYQGRIEGLLAGVEADIFATHSRKKEIKALKRKIRQQKEKLKDLEEEQERNDVGWTSHVGAFFGGGDNEALIDETDNTRDQVEADEEKLADMLQENREEAYDMFIRAMSESTRLFWAEIEPMAFGSICEGVMRPYATGNREGKALIAKPKFAAMDITMQAGGADAKSWNKFQKDVADVAEEQKQEDRDDDAGLENVRKRAGEAWKSSMQKGSYFFHWTYLGDIIDIAGVQSLIAYESPDTRVMLGSLVFNDPITGEYVQGVNLADVPISINLFRSWFMENIVRKGIVQMSFITFIRRVVKELIFPALGTHCAQTATPKGAKVNIQAIEIPKTSKKKDPLPHGSNGPKSGRLVVQGPLAKFSKSTYAGKSANYGLMSYLYIFATGMTISRFNGNAIADARNGIYHFAVGADGGLLKSADFSRVQQPGLKEFRSEQAMDEGGDQVDQVQETYNCNMTLIGNGLFRPGALFFVNPSFIGGGNPASRNSNAYKLGLGGYFVGLTVEGIIESGKFETILDGKYLGPGGGKNAQSAHAVRHVRMHEGAIERGNKVCGKEVAFGGASHKGDLDSAVYGYDSSGRRLSKEEIKQKVADGEMGLGLGQQKYAKNIYVVGTKAGDAPKRVKYKPRGFSAGAPKAQTAQEKYVSDTSDSAGDSGGGTIMQ